VRKDKHGVWKQNRKNDGEERQGQARKNDEGKTKKKKKTCGHHVTKRTQTILREKRRMKVERGHGEGETARKKKNDGHATGAGLQKAG